MSSLQWESGASQANRALLPWPRDFCCKESGRHHPGSPCDPQSHSEEQSKPPDFEQQAGRFTRSRAPPFSASLCIPSLTVEWRCEAGVMPSVGARPHINNSLWALPGGKGPKCLSKFLRRKSGRRGAQQPNGWEGSRQENLSLPPLRPDCK